MTHTCAVSHLPIHEGDAVRVVLLQSSPFTNGRYARGELTWYLRAPPVRATYEGHHEPPLLDPRDAFIASLWLEGFDVDIIERGYGEDLYRDAPARRGMTFDALVEALTAERVKVRRDLRTRAQQRDDTKAVSDMIGPRPVAKGIPTIRRVEALIRRAGRANYTVHPKGDDTLRVHGGPRLTCEPAEHPAHDPRCGFGVGKVVAETAKSVMWSLDNTKLANDAHGFVVDSLGRGRIRVRPGMYTPPMAARIRLEALARKLARRYAVMVTPGSDCAGTPEILVQPKPETMDGDHTFSFLRRTEAPETSHVGLAYVREDIWQGILAGAPPGEDVKTYRHQAKTYLDLSQRLWRSRIQSGLDDALYDGELLSGEPMYMLHYLTQNPSVNGAGLDSAWKMFVAKVSDEKVAPADITTFLTVLAETAVVDETVRRVRRDWRPGDKRAPNSPHWARHEAFLAIVARVVGEHLHDDE